MRINDLFTHTLRKAPPEARSAAHRLLVRGGYLRPISAGHFATLPLGQRVLQRLFETLQQSLEALHAQPITLPNDEPETWRALLAAEIHTYRQLPAALYDFHPRTHPPKGLLRARHGWQLSLAWLHPNAKSLAAARQTWEDSLQSLLQIWGIQTVQVENGEAARAWVYPHPEGETTLRVCPACGYRATLSAARFRKPTPPQVAPYPLEPVHTPGSKTIADLATFLNIPEAQTAKAVFLKAEPDEALIFAVLRGDMALDEEKLMRLCGYNHLRPATEEEIRAIGAEPGFASPVGISSRPGLCVVVDDLIPHSPNLVAGANRPDTHLRNVNYGRDFTADIVGDIVAVPEGAPCPQCASPLQAESGVRLAEIHPLRETAQFNDEHGAQSPLHAALCTLDVSTALACIVESHHDKYGPIWPSAIAPFDLHIVALPGKQEPAHVLESATRLYIQLKNAGYRVLLDERHESPGVKFNDADLFGVPWRLTVGERALVQGGVEVKARAEKERVIVPLEEVTAYLAER